MQSIWKQFVSTALETLGTAVKRAGGCLFSQHVSAGRQGDLPGIFGLFGWPRGCIVWHMNNLKSLLLTLLVLSPTSSFAADPQIIGINPPGSCFDLMISNQLLSDWKNEYARFTAQYDSLPPRMRRELMANSMTRLSDALSTLDRSIKREDNHELIDDVRLYVARYKNNEFDAKSVEDIMKVNLELLRTATNKSLNAAGIGRCRGGQPAANEAAPAKMKNPLSSDAQ